jgi:hypothetical protein
LLLGHGEVGDMNARKGNKSPTIRGEKRGAVRTSIQKITKQGSRKQLYSIYEHLGSLQVVHE